MSLRITVESVLTLVRYKNHTEMHRSNVNKRPVWYKSCDDTVPLLNLVFNIIRIVKWCDHQETLTLQIWRHKLSTYRNSPFSRPLTKNYLLNFVTELTLTKNHLLYIYKHVRTCAEYIGNWFSKPSSSKNRIS